MYSVSLQAGLKFYVIDYFLEWTLDLNWIIYSVVKTLRKFSSLVNSSYYVESMSPNPLDLQVFLESTWI